MTIEEKKPLDYQKIIQMKRKQNPLLPLYMVIYDILKDNIMTCEFPPGYRLKENELSEQFQVSRTTIKNAMDSLQFSGLITKEGARGMCVQYVSLSQCNQISEFRRLMDPIVAGLASVRKTQRDLDEMYKCIEGCASEEPNLFLSADSSFHYAIYVAAKNEYLLNAYKQIDTDRKRLNYYVIGIITKKKQWQFLSSIRDRMREGHLEIYKAIEKADTITAQKLARKHIGLSLIQDTMELIK